MCETVSNWPQISFVLLFTQKGFFLLCTQNGIQKSKLGLIYTESLLFCAVTETTHSSWELKIKLVCPWNSPHVESADALKISKDVDSTILHCENRISLVLCAVDVHTRVLIDCDLTLHINKNFVLCISSDRIDGKPHPNEPRGEKRSEKAFCGFCQEKKKMH